MIIFAHYLYFLIKFLRNKHREREVKIEFRRINNECLDVETAYQNAIADIEEANSLTFDPPVCLQRYSVVQQVLLEHQALKEIKKVVEFGCGSFALFSYLKNIYGIDKVLEVDIDEDVLKDNIGAVLPKDIDYLNSRSVPFIVDVLCGSLGDPDYRLNEVDAVIAIEVIEHLYPDSLDALSYNIFGYINPDIFILTTPNADFNVLFPNFKGFRHFDHKFEWSREQFHDWAVNQTMRFPEYTVEIKGIGEGPRGTERVGCCSQMAVFTKKYEKTSSEMATLTRLINIPTQSYGICKYRISNETNCDNTSNNRFYKLVDSIEYPFTQDTRCTRQKIFDESMSILYRNISKCSRFFNKDNNCVEVPLYELLTNISGQFSTVEQLRSIFDEAHFLVKECLPPRFCENVLCVVYDINVDSANPMSDSEDDESVNFNRCRGVYNIISSFESESESEADWDFNTSNVREAQMIVLKALDASISEEFLGKDDEWSQWDGSLGDAENNYLDNLDNQGNVSLDDENGELNPIFFEDNSNLSSINEDEEYNLQNWDAGDFEELAEDNDHVDEVSGLGLEYEEAGDANRHDEVELGVNEASLEGLFDTNSQVDMLSGSEFSLLNLVQESQADLSNNQENNQVEFEVTENNKMDFKPIPQETPADLSNTQTNNQIELDVSIHESQTNLSNNQENPQLEVEATVQESQGDENIFPGWLLGILDNQSHQDFSGNFNCKGDGVGVHGLYTEYHEDSSTSSMSDSNDEAQAENALSEDDVSLLPEDTPLENRSRLRDLEYNLPSNDFHPTCSRISNENDDDDEFFDTLDQFSEDEFK